MTRELDSLSQVYPSIAYMESLGVSTLDHRVIWGFKVSDHAAMDEDEPAVLYVGTHHGCEMIGMEFCLYLIESLLADYGSDPQATRWVDETEIWFVPLFNPDGYWAVYSDLDHQWRKNARDTDLDGGAVPR
jgi:murein tripeptide amidase MpaA